MSVRIVFRTPRRENISQDPEKHLRELTGVPQSVAEQMVKDFEIYERKPSDSSQRKLYRYNSGADREDPETIVALDFDEVIAVKAIRAR